MKTKELQRNINEAHHNRKGPGGECSKGKNEGGRCGRDLGEKETDERNCL